MNDHPIHEHHNHRHGANCGHPAVSHDGHTDYLHDGHLHHLHGDHVDEHRLDITAQNPAGCTPTHRCEGYEAEHRHGTSCGHQAVPHGDHIDYLVAGRLHFTHGVHCDDHGILQLA